MTLVGLGTSPEVRDRTRRRRREERRSGVFILVEIDPGK